MATKSLFEILIASLLILISCGEENKNLGKKPAPSADATPIPTPTYSKEIEKLKARITELSSNPAEPIDDGWRLVPFNLDPDKIMVNSALLVRVDFSEWDLVLRRTLHLTLSGCDGIKMVGTGERDVATIQTNTIKNGEVGSVVETFLYRSDGAITPPTNPCTLTAKIIDIDGSEISSKKKEFTLEKGVVRLIQPKNLDGVNRPYFALDSNNNVTLSIDTEGIITDDDLRIGIYREDTRRKEYIFIGSALVFDFPKDGKINRVKVCSRAMHAYEKGNIYCGLDLNNKEWLTTIPQGNHLLVVQAYDRDTGVVAVRSALIETGELEE